MAAKSMIWVAAALAVVASVPALATAAVRSVPAAAARGDASFSAASSDAGSAAIRPRERAHGADLSGRPARGPVESTSETRVLERISARDRALVDASGRVRVFHGVNDVRKSEPYLSSFTDEQLDEIANDWGFNILRLGFSWEGYERERGVTDPAYMEATGEMVTRLAGFNIHTIIDVHQDLYTRIYCGNGFPDWAAYVKPETAEVAPFPIPVLGDVIYEPDPTTGKIRGEDCGRSYWGTYYFSNVTGSIFQSFYDNVDGIQESFSNMWLDIARAFAGRPEVFGLEPINEPFPGNIHEDPLLLLNATMADELLLVPLFDRVHAAVRSVDNQTIFMPTMLVSNSEVAPRTTGIRTPGGPEYRDRGVFSFHFYCAMSEDRPDYCSNFLQASFVQRNRDSERLGLPHMLTEFGWLYSTEEDQAANNTAIVRLADEQLVSWITWDYGFIRTRPLVLASLIYPYPQAIAGTPVGFTFDPDTRVFSFQFRINLAIAAPTEIFVPAVVHYTSGYSVALTPAGAAQWSAQPNNRIWIEPTDAATPDQLISVRITPLL